MAGGALLATAACSFVGSVSYFKLVDDDGFDFKDAAATKGGKVVALECKKDGACRLSVYKGDDRANRTDLPQGTSYFGLDYYEDPSVADNAFILARKSRDTQGENGLTFELWGIGNDNQVKFWQLIDWHHTSNERDRWVDLNDMAVGRDGHVYVAGTFKFSESGQAVPTLARYTVEMLDQYEVLEPVHQTHRPDNNHALTKVALVDCDPTSGRVYATDVSLSGTEMTSSILVFKEGLSRGDPPHPQAQVTHSEITSLQATDGLVGITSVSYDSDRKADTTVWLDIFQNNGTTWEKYDESKDGDHIHSYGALLTYQNTNNDCGYAWTVAKHVFDASQQTYKVLGRHKFCRVGDED
jgi:hypothetical protein